MMAPVTQRWGELESGETARNIADPVAYRQPWATIGRSRQYPTILGAMSRGPITRTLLNLESRNGQDAAP